jgi:hypothetical protein
MLGVGSAVLTRDIFAVEVESQISASSSSQILQTQLLHHINHINQNFCTQIYHCLQFSQFFSSRAHTSQIHSTKSHFLAFVSLAIMSFELPNELWLQVFEDLDYADLKRCQRVSKSFNALINAPYLDRNLFRGTVLPATAPIEFGRVNAHPALCDLVSCHFRESAAAISKLDLYCLQNLKAKI